MFLVSLLAVFSSSYLDLPNLRALCPQYASWCALLPRLRMHLRAATVISTLCSGIEGLAFTEGLFKKTFDSYVNGTFLWSPVVKGFGLDRFEPFVVDVVRNTYNWTGRGVLLDALTSGLSPERAIMKELKRGASLGYGTPRAVFVWGGLPYAGFVGMARENIRMKGVNIPVLDVSLNFWVLVTVFNNETKHSGHLMPVTILIRDDDRNPLRLEWPWGYVILCVIPLTALCLACFIVDTYKLIMHLKYSTGLTIPKLFFIIDGFANVMRFWFVCVNPFFVHEFAYMLTTICTTTHVALTIICTLLLSLKWQELLQRTEFRATVFLSRFRWPFIIASFIIFAVEFVSASLRGHWYSLSNLSVVSWSFLAVVSFVVIALCFVSGVQIVSQIIGVTSPASGRIWPLTRTTVLIMASGVFLLAWTSSEIAFLIKVYRYKKMSLIETNTLTALQLGFLFACSLLQSWAMPIPNQGFTPPRHSATSGTLVASSGYTDNSARIAGSNYTFSARESAVEFSKESFTESSHETPHLPPTDDSTSSSTDFGDYDTSSGSEFSSESKKLV